tara:strand:+ start:1827 stop:2873 length:1047 start_codon:yes stop_codon:yes gene_type:complete
MQIWPYLPRLDNEGPSIDAVIKRAPEDFVVEEIAAYEPSGSGDHLYLWLEKRDVSAEGLLKHLSRSLKISSRDIGAAGMKDRRALTRQWVSVPASAEAKLGQVDSGSVRVLKSVRHRNKLKTGHLVGNRFEIHVRGIAKPLRESVCEAAGRMAERGFPNYFGPQRFGHDGQTAKTGFDLLKGKLKPQQIPRQRRRFLIRLAISAAQSMVFNSTLAARIKEEAIATVEVGDVLQKTASGGLFVCEDAETDQGRLESGEVTLTGPMHGPKMKRPEGKAARWDGEGLQKWKLSEEQFEEFSRVAHGTRRPLIVSASDLTAEPATGGVKLQFTLPSGVYATVLLRELVGLES